MVAALVLRSYSPARRGPGEWGRHAVALGILRVALLPVFSMADKIRGWTSPAEMQRGLRGADSLPGIAIPSQILTLCFHDVLTTMIPISRPFGQLALCCDSCKQQTDELHPIENDSRTEVLRLFAPLLQSQLTRDRRVLPMNPGTRL